jgi:hypothetical protein
MGSRRVLVPAAISAAWVGVPAPASWAQALGGGRSVDVPVVQILAGLLLCSLAAFAFALFLKRRTGARAPLFQHLLSRAAPDAARDGIAVIETRRLSNHADVCRFRSGDREFLVVVTASSCTVVRETAISVPAAHPMESTS